MITPASKLFRVIKGSTFQYRFQYLSGTPQSSVPINLTGYSATWAINWTVPSVGHTYYTTALTPSGSGVVFGGGPPATPSNGIIDLIISSTDSAAIPWTTAQHQFGITDTGGVTLVLITGGIAVVGSFPS